MVNEDNPTWREPVGLLSIWGLEVLKDFGDNKVR